MFAPARGKWKPPGLPRLDKALAPPGLTFCCPFADPDGTEIVTGTKRPAAFIGSGIFPFRPTAYGIGYPPFYMSAWKYPHQASANGRFVLEAVVLAGSETTNGIILAYSSNYAYIRVSSNRFEFLCWNGTSYTLIYDTVNVATWTYYHIVAVSNGSNLYLYINGAQVASSASASATPAAGTFQIGDTSNDHRTWVILFATLTMGQGWDATYAARRFIEPYEFLVFPEDELLNAAVGVGVSGGAASLRMHREQQRVA